MESHLEGAQACLRTEKASLPDGDGRFFVLPIASVLFRLAGEQCALGSFGGGVGGFLLVLIAGPAARPLMEAIGSIPLAPSIAGVGFMAAASILITFAGLGFAALFAFYLLAEVTLVLADIANNVGRLLVVREHTRGGEAPAARMLGENVAEPKESPGNVPDMLPRRCLSCHTVVTEHGRFCEHCGAPLDAPRD